MRIAVIGSSEGLVTKNQREFAFKLGKILVDEGFEIINGGMGGVMEAIAKGAKESLKFVEKSVIGILPVPDIAIGNTFSGITIVTDMGSGRNRLIILNSDAVIAIGGGAGTLNELTLAWEFNKPIAVYSSGGGWAEKLAGEKIDPRKTQTIRAFDTIHAIIDWLKSYSKDY